MTLYGYPRETPAPDDAPSPDEASARPPAPAEAGYADAYDPGHPQPPAPKGYRGTRRAQEPDDASDRYLPQPRIPAEPLMPAEPLPGASGPHWSDPRWPVADAGWPEPTPASPHLGPEHWSAEPRSAPPSRPVGEPFPSNPPPYEPAAYEPTQYEPSAYEPTQYEPMPYDPLASTPAADNYLSPRFAPNGLGLDTQSFNGFAVNGSTPATDEAGSRFGSDELWSAPADRDSGRDPLESSSDARGFSAFGQPDTAFSAFGQPDATPFSAFGQPDPGFNAFGQPNSQEDPGRNGHDLAPGLSDTGHSFNDLAQDVNDLGHGVEETARGLNGADPSFGRPEPSPAWPEPSRLDPSRSDTGRTDLGPGRESHTSEYGRLDPGPIGQMGQPDHWPTDWTTDTTTTFSGRVPVSPAPTATGPMVPVSPPPVTPAPMTPSAAPAIPPIGQAPTVPLTNALPLVPAHTRPPTAHIPDWTEIEIPGEDDDEIVPWDRKPLMIVIIAGVILVLLGIAAGVVASKIFYPGQTVTSWHPAQPENSPPR